MEVQPLDPERVARKSGRFLLPAVVIGLVLVVAGLGVYTWYALYGPCSKGAVKTASAALLDQTQAFEEAYQSASSATPIGLIGPVTSMEQTVWDTREIQVPACMQVARNELLTSMESAVRADLAIMNGEPGQTIKNLQDDSLTHLKNFAIEMDAVGRCAPFCLQNPE